MVINVFVEGGVTSNNVDADTIANSEALREELNRFLQRVLNRNDISIVVKNYGGYKNVAKFFINDEATESYLYTDLDRIPEKKNEWFESLSNDGIVMPKEKADKVFFWIQEMEAWFLKQPQAIEDWACQEGYTHLPKHKAHLSQHKSIKGKDIEHLQQKASEIMTVILRQVFSSNDKKNISSKSGKIRRLRYEKLRHAPGIIAYLNHNDLLAIDSELMNFCNRIQQV